MIGDARPKLPPCAAGGPDDGRMRVADAGRSGQWSEVGTPRSDSAVQRALRGEIERARRRRVDSRCAYSTSAGAAGVGGADGGRRLPGHRGGHQPERAGRAAGRARDAGVADRVTATQGDVHALVDAVPAAGADLVLGHGLLEVVDDVAAAVGQLAEAVVPGGALSVLVAGRYGAALALAHAGRVNQARAVLTDPVGRSGPTDKLQRRLDVVGLRGLLESAARLSIELVQGDGVFEGWLPGAVLESAAGGGEGVAELAGVVAGTPELLVLAARLHMLARRPSPTDRSRPDRAGVGRLRPPGPASAGLGRPGGPGSRSKIDLITVLDSNGCHPLGDFGRPRRGPGAPVPSG